jgi:hypothetical protein
MLKSEYLEFFGKGTVDASSRFECKFCGFIVIETINQFDKRNLQLCVHIVFWTQVRQK